MKTLSQKKKDLAAIFAELEAGQKKMTDGTLTAEEGTALEAKAKEAEALQAEIDQATRIEKLVTKGRAFDPHTPDVSGKADDSFDPEDKVVGYISLGDAFTQSPEFKKFIEEGMPQHGSLPYVVKSSRERFIGITKKMLERKATPTLGATVIMPDRLAEIIRVTEPQRVRMRDVLDNSRTNSNAVEYVTLVSYTDAAAPVAESAVKPESTLALGTATAPVRTLAVWMPITEQMLSDAPAVSGMINGELRDDLKRLEDRQFLYGAGTGQNLLGINVHADVPTLARTLGAGTTNIDRVRMMITDIASAEYEPNALVIHPLDWEGIVLAKGTDSRYVWATIVTDTGPRIWGLTVVETAGAKNPLNLQRFMTVGDFRRGATIWDREDAAVAIGWINDQFIKNQRTIRAEERLAFGIKRPHAFEKYETATAV